VTEACHVWDTFLRVLEDCKDVSFAIVYAHHSLNVSAPNPLIMRAQSSFNINAYGDVMLQSKGIVHARSSSLDMPEPNNRQIDRINLVPLVWYLYYHFLSRVFNQIERSGCVESRQGSGSAKLCPATV
jgi:hypothetical protein